MKKTFLCIMILILLTGCSTEYNLEFKNGKFKDNVKIGEFNSEKISDFAYLEPIASYKDYEIKYYDFNYKDNYLNLNHEYSFDEYRVSSALMDCFELTGVTYDDDYYYILTSGEFKCLTYLGYDNEKIKINFTTDLEVESSNADIVVDNVYSWIYNDKNYKDKEISIKLIRKKASNDAVEEKSNLIDNDIIIYFLIVIPLGIVCYIFYKIFKKYSNNKNKIPD